ncbi:ankyrin repeat-containing domain protein [Alternaria rosae]|uniref:ankyrin repeat-containing domain protein n=1 Tax=Alternaria rosae TaxID=1187941 RepID=UPI001E8D3B69|nr:ankyrin repeat-containing domain protein [Alternaria rosae]KAH6875409.1 ankyrin repeat-containing domain protein [Alternaria rosae]
MCIRCPVGYSRLTYSRLNPREIVYDKHNENLPPSLLPHAELGRRQDENMNKDGRNGDLEMSLFTFRRDQEHETGHNLEDRHAPELQPQPQPTESQKQVVSGVLVKRNLDMSKCERCRLDKKKCLPTDRVWPTKCELCIKKGFSCSESKRLFRSTKHALTPILSSTNVASTSATSVAFEECLKQWSFLLSYRTMMWKAWEEDLEDLKERAIAPFSPENHPSLIPVSASYNRFYNFVNSDIDEMLGRYSEELLNVDTASPNIPGWFLVASLSQFGTKLACSECYPAHSRSKARWLEETQDTCGELLLVQHRYIHHTSFKGRESYIDLSKEVAKRASAVWESSGTYDMAEYARKIGVWHSDKVLFELHDWVEDLNDCLERSHLHFYMDWAANGSLIKDEFYFYKGLSELKDSQDILGRTALLIACQEEWEEAVVRLLEEKADPGLSTIYGSLPLHYAAATGSLEICKLLLMHKTEFDIKAADNASNTALDWAKEKGHYEVVELLSIQYAATN